MNHTITKYTASLCLFLFILSFFSSVAETSITISSAGDFTLGGDVKSSGFTSFRKLYSEHGDEWFLENVKSVFEADDLTIVNFEGTIPTTKYKLVRKEFNFRCLPSCTGILTSSGIEAVTVANNHSHDFGDQVFESTVKVLSDSGLEVFGYDRVSDIEINGVKITLCGFTWWENRSDCMEQIKRLRENCDLLIVTMHWGGEGVYETNENQVWWAHGIIDAGADLILGSHTHLIGGLEMYKGKYIVYSLGNFCFGGNAYPKDYDTYIFQQKFIINDDGISDGGIKVIPCLISSDREINNCQPVLAEGYDYNRIIGKVQRYSTTYWPKMNWFE